MFSSCVSSNCKLLKCTWDIGNIFHIPTIKHGKDEYKLSPFPKIFKRISRNINNIHVCENCYLSDGVNQFQLNLVYYSPNCTKVL